MIRQIIFWTIFLSVVEAAYGQKRYFPHYTTADGLPSNTVYKVVKDERGFLWLATSNGICRFDGHHFETFSLKGLVNDVEFIDIYIGKQGRIWFIPFSGDVLLYDGYTFQNGKDFFGTSFQSVQQIYEDDFGHVWIVKQAADIFRFHLSSRILTVIKGKAYSYKTIVNILSPHEVFVNDGYHCLELFSRKSLFSLPESFSRNRPRIIYHVDSLQYIYPSNSAICFYNAGKINTIQVPELPYKNTIFVNLHSKTVCVGTSDRGLFLFKMEGDKLSYVSNELPGRSITYTAPDNEGNIWIATYNDGLYCMSPQAAYQISNIGIYNTEPLSVGKLDRELLIGLNRGNIEIVVDNIPRKSIDFEKSYSVKPLTSRVKNIRIRPKAAWMSYENILYHYNGRTFKSYFINGNIKDIAFSDSLIFLATHHGAYISTENQLAECEIKPPFTTSKYHYLLSNHSDKRKINLERTTAIAYDPFEKRLWIGQTNGLMTFSHRKIDSTLKNNVVKPQIPDILPPALQNFKYRITALATLPDGSLVIGTTVAGIFFYRNRQLYSLSVEEGLSNNFVQSFFVSNDKTLWASTINGLNKIRIENVLQKKWQITVYNVSNGLATNVVNDVFVKNDSIWVATTGGVTFLKDISSSAKLPILVHITNVWADGHLTLVTPHLSIESKEEIRFNFYAISRQWAGNVRYRFRLSGNMFGSSSSYSQWSNTDEHTAVFTKLLPGSYRFELEAISKERGLLLGKTSLNFKVMMPWYLNPIIQGSLITSFCFALLTVLFMYYYRRERKARAFNEEFNELEKQAFRAQMNPHFIFNCLNAIQEFLLNNESEQAHRYLSQFAKLIRKSLDFTKHSSVCLTDEIDFLRLYIKLEQLRYLQPFRVEVNIHPSVKANEIEVPSLLLQPFVENAIRHGQLGRMREEGLLKIDFEFAEKYLYCTIDDNGVGLEFSQSAKTTLTKEHTSQGLDIVKKRIKLINQLSDESHSIDVFDKKHLNPPLRGTRVLMKLYTG
ncbi:sensor histidine kinase [Runella aurantiaca]|nr:histidine kinase [Runella aurantiaca]